MAISLQSSTAQVTIPTSTRDSASIQENDSALHASVPISLVIKSKCPFQLFDIISANNSSQSSRQIPLCLPHGGSVEVAVIAPCARGMVNGLSLSLRLIKYAANRVGTEIYCRV